MPVDARATILPQSIVPHLYHSGREGTTEVENVTLTTRTLAALTSYWTKRLGVENGAFDRSNVTIGGADEGGVELFRRAETLVVGAPESLVDPLSQRADGLEASDIADESALREWFETFGTVTRVLGPTFYGYADEESFAPVASDARILTSADEPAHDRFRAAISDEEWERAGARFSPGETVGLFVDDDLVATAGYEVWDDFIAHVGVVTHPNHRNEGNGRAVVSRVTERALGEGLLPQYRTADEWPWSVALARELGFERFATAVLVCIE
ncbi:GNAT family N-acetyltransferase [Haladaptatus halobius]|uniref:GNAT family N-acetyltransferase n=1 Tax=Haladaptatus halobius TaxID=2884875 RepID=UPI001D0AF7FB|nr:GNAT family N-acetyltransferase [Haladaptatus halobius]